jgi:hypothetical protein
MNSTNDFEIASRSGPARRSVSREPACFLISLRALCGESDGASDAARQGHETDSRQLPYE